MADFSRLKGLLLSPLVLLALAGGAVAIWAGAMSITGSFSATGGSQSQMQTFESPLSIGNNSIFYNNQDSAVRMQVNCSLYYTSTDARCAATGADAWVQLIDDSGNWTNCTAMPTLTLEAGQNEIRYRAALHPNACPIEGYWAMTGTIV